MSENINITSPVKIESDSKARVAFELMEKIVRNTSDETQRKDKAYWLSLYRQCYKATNGDILKYILQDEPLS